MPLKFNFERRTQRMEEIYIDATLKEAVSEKSGKKYMYVSLMLTPTLEKKVFLEQSEIECIKLTNK